MPVIGATGNMPQEGVTFSIRHILKDCDTKATTWDVMSSEDSAAKVTRLEMATLNVQAYQQSIFPGPMGMPTLVPSWFPWYTEKDRPPLPGTESE